MKLEIFDSELPNEEPVRLRLRKSGSIIDVIVVDANGVKKDGGILLAISSTGVHLAGCIDPRFGFALDSDKCLVRI